MTTTTNKTTAAEADSVRQRLRDVGLYGLAVQDHAVLTEPWVERVIDIEDRERKRRSLERRLTNARIGAFKPIADFDWTWPKRIDRPSSRSCSRWPSSMTPPTSSSSGRTESASRC